MDKSEAWAHIHEYYEESSDHELNSLSGNREGLLEIKKLIDKALDEGEAKTDLDLTLKEVVFEDTLNPQHSHSQGPSGLKGTFVGIGFALWFFILPVLAIAGLAYLLIKAL